MARIRTIKPGFFASEDMAALDVRTRLTFAGLWTYADDYGNANANPKLIKAALWSLDDDVSPAHVQADLKALAKQGQILLYEMDGRSYLSIVKWSSHQRVDRPTKSDIPAPLTQAREDDTSPREDSSRPREDDALEGKGGEEEGRGDDPAPHCKKHPGGTDKPCIPCRNARLAFEAKASKPKPTVSGLFTPAQCKTHGMPDCPYCAEGKAS